MTDVVFHFEPKIIKSSDWKEDGVLSVLRIFKEVLESGIWGLCNTGSQYFNATARSKFRSKSIFRSKSFTNKSEHRDWSLDFFVLTSASTCTSQSSGPSLQRLWSVARLILS